VPRPDDFLAGLGAQLIADGLPLAGGALTLAAPHPIIARRACSRRRRHDERLRLR
jgi:adenylate cyclase